VINRRKIAGFLCVFLAGVTLPPQTQAQSQTEIPSSSSKIRAVTNEVIVPVTVTDKTGEFVLDLSQKDFHVFDDGAEQSIDHWELGNDSLAVVLVLETSSRLRGTIPAIRSLGSIFTETVMALHGEAAVLTYDSTVELRQPFTQDHDAIEGAIANAQFEAPERTLYDAMAQAEQMLEAQPTDRRRIMLIVGESQDVGSKTRLGAVLREATQANITIYAVGPSSVVADFRGKNSVEPIQVGSLPPISPSSCVDGLGHPCVIDLATPTMALLERGTNEIKNHHLEVAAAATGGVHYRAFRDSAIRDALDRVGAELHAQYILSYRPSGERSPGFHSIRVAVARDGVSVRARPGYSVAAPPAN
jgi:VWFA-related protein